MRKRVEATFAILLILLCVGMRLAYTGNEKLPERGEDLIILDALDSFGERERPAVRFPHEKHVADEQGASNCLVCHEPRSEEGSGIKFAFKNRDGLSREAVKDLYHSECLGCHADLEAAGQPSGPQICSECHVNSSVDSPRSSHTLHFDASLHALHEDAASLDCQACHDSSGAVQRVVAQDASHPVSPKNSSHALCITCHLNVRTSGETSAPLDCTGCHANPPASASSSEDTLLSENVAHGGEVTFDHDLHESADIACDVCHHKEPETSCSECHTDGASPESGGITLQVAMHTRSSERSCLGCHESMGAGVVDDCTGCHEPFTVGHK
ncbi:cytochrome c3 family protein [Desulfoluna sp.]|uniref:cytochrome c3 family protein n=1 Tax=Desulfoluna sp. TaxID=2045199 RepID=UPI003459D0DE